ncbi:hypothetical protein HPB48_000660 [Haemaphysalis longicornis]|uniref:Uncharacterized protein n=1 Tax=Haemaphysalis longicornis TaxID=44386 RepID=A0A9J6G0N7_HAELO|nr:hypothetical protein HPB48_000660 [Haemaphysalis longicornis]
MNTFEETKEATLIVQKQRLQSTRTGRAILKRVGTPADKTDITSKVDLGNDIRRKLYQRYQDAWTRQPSKEKEKQE